MKNHNHQQNNIHQFIIALQRDKLDLQSQMQLQLQSYEVKKVEAEKLQKDLRQLKEKYHTLKKSKDKNATTAASGGSGGEPTEVVVSSSAADIVTSIDGKATPSKKKKKKRHGSTLSSTGSVSSLADKEELLVDMAAETGEAEKESDNAGGKFASGCCYENDANNFLLIGMGPPTTSMSQSSFDWDKQSTSSSVSLANLQDRINQMEETHYSTSEELQATLQELNDLQDQVHRLQLENEQLDFDKILLAETLCAQDKKLKTLTKQMSHMQKLVIEQYKDEKTHEMLQPSEREQELIEVLRICKEELSQLSEDKTELKSTVEDLKQKYLDLEGEHYELYAKLR